MMREVRRKGGGAAHRECGCSSLRVRWWWMVTMNSHGVEVSIAGCVGEMVRDPNPMPRGCPYIHQQKNTLRQIRRCFALTEATSLLRSLCPVLPEFRCNAPYPLTRRRVVLTPCLHLSSGSLHFLLMMAPASPCLFRAP